MVIGKENNETIEEFLARLYSGYPCQSIRLFGSCEIDDTNDQHGNHYLMILHDQREHSSKAAVQFSARRVADKQINNERYREKINEIPFS